MPQPQEENKYAPTAWGHGNLREITTPSGQTCLVRTDSLQALMQAGVLHDVDSLTSLVSMKHIAKAQGKGPITDDQVKELVSNPGAIESMLHVVDRIVCHIVVQPPVHMTPNDTTNRKQGVVYTDMISLEDRMFLMNLAVGGTDDVATFRREAIANMGGMVAVESDEVPAQ